MRELKALQDLVVIAEADIKDILGWDDEKAKLQASLKVLEGKSAALLAALADIDKKYCAIVNKERAEAAVARGERPPAAIAPNGSDSFTRFVQPRAQADPMYKKAETMGGQITAQKQATIEKIKEGDTEHKVLKARYAGLKAKIQAAKAALDKAVKALPERDPQRAKVAAYYAKHLVALKA